jgi:hypothetical protein
MSMFRCSKGKHINCQKSGRILPVSLGWGADDAGTVFAVYVWKT